MFVLKVHIKIGKRIFEQEDSKQVNFEQVNEVEITRSLDLLGNTAVIKPPHSDALKQAIEVGNEVEIKIGYEGFDFFDTPAFKGVVTAIEADTPMVIHCGDAAIQKLKGKNCNENFTDITLRKVMDHILEGTGISLAETPTINLNRYLLKDQNGLEALAKIKEDFGLNTFLDEDKGTNLFTSFWQSYKGLDQVVDYRIGHNVIRHDLKFKTKKEAALQVKVVGITNDNKKIEVEAGSRIEVEAGSGGPVETFYQYNVTNEPQLAAIARSKLAIRKQEGYHGTLTSFLTPFADRGMTAKLYDEDQPERSGKYLISKVVTTYNENGGRREIELGRKLL